MKRHICMFSSQNDFKILSYLLLIIDFINHIHYCIQIDIIMLILIFLILHIFNFSLFENSHDKNAVKYCDYKIHKKHLK